MRRKFVIIGVVALVLIGLAYWWFALNTQNLLLGKWESPATGTIIEFTSSGGYSEDSTNGVKGGNYQWSGGDSLKITSAFNFFTTAKVKLDNGNLIFDNPPGNPSATYKKYKELLFDPIAIEGSWKTLKGESNCVRTPSIFFNRDGSFVAPVAPGATPNGRYILDNTQLYSLNEANANQDAVKNNGAVCRLILSQSRMTLYDRAGQILVLIRQ